MAAYSRGSSTNIIVGAAALFIYEGTAEFADSAIPVAPVSTSMKDALQGVSPFRNVGYTKNGLELAFTPDFGEVVVDQILDVAKLYKKGMKVTLKTELVESTLENLMLAVSRPKSDSYVGPTTTTATNWVSAYVGEDVLNLSAGDLGDIPLERGLVAVGPGTGDATFAGGIERIYVGYRALSIEAVTIASKRDAESSFAVNFRMLPNNAGSYGKVVDRTLSAVARPGFPS